MHSKSLNYDVFLLLLPQSDQYVIINHNLTQSPDKFRIIDVRNGSSTPLSFSSNNNGDWYFDSNSNNLYYISKTRFTIEMLNMISLDLLFFSVLHQCNDKYLCTRTKMCL